MLKTLIQKAINKFGYQINKVVENSRFDDIHRQLINIISPKKVVIFDVGAHRGESVKRFRNIFPDSIIHSFEPDKDNFSDLKNKGLFKTLEKHVFSIMCRKLHVFGAHPHDTS